MTLGFEIGSETQKEKTRTTKKKTCFSNRVVVLLRAPASLSRSKNNEKRSRNARGIRRRLFSDFSWIWGGLGEVDEPRMETTSEIYVMEKYRRHAKSGTKKVMSWKNIIFSTMSNFSEPFLLKRCYFRGSGGFNRTDNTLLLRLSPRTSHEVHFLTQCDQKHFFCDKF